MNNEGEIEGRNAELGSFRAEEIHFDFEFLEVLFLGSFPALLHRFAKLAGMLAIKCLLQRHREAVVMAEVDGHAHPGDRLQQSPVAARREDERANQQPFAEMPQHDCFYRRWYSHGNSIPLRRAADFCVNHGCNVGTFYCEVTLFVAGLLRSASELCSRGRHG